VSVHRKNPKPLTAVRPNMFTAPSSDLGLAMIVVTGGLTLRS